MIVSSAEEISYEEWKRRCSLNNSDETFKVSASHIPLFKTKSSENCISQECSDNKLINKNLATNDDDDSLKQISESSSDQESNSSFYTDVFSSIDFEFERVLEEERNEKENTEETPDSPNDYEPFWDAVEQQEKVLSQENIFTSSFENLTEKENNSKQTNPVSEKYDGKLEKRNSELEFDESELEKYFPKEQDINELCNSPDFKLFNTLIEMNYYSDRFQLDPIREESYSELEEYENDNQIRRLSKNKFASAKNNLNKISNFKQ